MRISHPTRPTITTLCRGAALFLGSFAIVNLIASFSAFSFDGNIWWIDLRWLPNAAQKLLCLVFGATMLNYALRFRERPVERRISVLVISAAVLVLIANSIDFFLLLARGLINSAFPAPVTLVIAVFLLAIMTTLREKQQPPVRPARACVVAAVFAAAFVFMQMLALGKTDYARRGDIAVVFGARVYANGTLSDAAIDRVLTACNLYRRGNVQTLLFSGGPGDGNIHETEAMKRVAMEHGVPDSAIILDRGGLNTRSTAQNTTKIFKTLGAHRVLAVSHFYHLPRVKLAYQQEGCDVFTVPAHSDRVLLKLPVFMAREGVALFKYYFDPFVASNHSAADDKTLPALKRRSA
jgi:vancomycin permeability regulator SanA